MARVLILVIRLAAHVEALVKAAAEGVTAAGRQVDVERVPETVPGEVAACFITRSTRMRCS